MKKLLDRIYTLCVKKEQNKSILQIAALLLALLLTATGCGLFAADEEAQGALPIRTAQPTFTPTIATVAQEPAQTTPAAVSQDQSPPDAANSAQPSTAAKAVINGPLVNARSGPGTDFDIIGEIERGAEFDIIGVNPDRSWWQICCIEDVQAWVTSEFVDTLGLVDSVPIIGGAAPQEALAAATDPPVVAAVTAAATDIPAPVANFALEAQEQFPETGVVRIFLYVFSDNRALEGYSLRVTKDGTNLPVEGTSFGGQPALTWPFQDPRQRFQNFKVEYPDIPSQGVWQVQLIDNTGATVGPPSTFTLSSNDPLQELYVRYAQR